MQKEITPMKRYWPNLLSIGALMLAALSATSSAGAGPLQQIGVQEGAPTVISYQGQVFTAGAVYSGPADFKFAILNASNATTWSNDGTSTGGLEPTNWVPLTVTGGQFNVLLGSAGMSPLTFDAFLTPDTYLRVWFRPEGGAFEQLVPDHRIAAVPYAMQAEVAKQVETFGGYTPDQFTQIGHGHSGADISSGTLGTSYYSARADLAAEGYLGNASGDLALNNGTVNTNLNADLLDGQHSTSFVDTGSSQVITGVKAFIAAPSFPTAPSFTAAGAPMVVSSTTAVANLNADLVDGRHAGELRAVVATATYLAVASLGTSCGAYSPSGSAAVISLATPGPGTMVVEATVLLNLSSSVDVALAISDSSGDCHTTAAHVTRWRTGPPNYYQNLFPPIGESHYNMALTLQVRRSFAIPASGTYTYYLNGLATNPPTGANRWESADLLARYYP
jgi:hypothetical protein